MQAVTPPILIISLMVSTYKFPAPVAPLYPAIIKEGFITRLTPLHIYLVCTNPKVILSADEAADLIHARTLIALPKQIFESINQRLWKTLPNGTIVDTRIDDEVIDLVLSFFGDGFIHERFINKIMKSELSEGLLKVTCGNYNYWLKAYKKGKSWDLHLYDESHWWFGDMWDIYTYHDGQWSRTDENAGY